MPVWQSVIRNAPVLGLDGLHWCLLNMVLEAPQVLVMIMGVFIAGQARHHGDLCHLIIRTHGLHESRSICTGASQVLTLPEAPVEFPKIGLQRSFMRTVGAQGTLTQLPLMSPVAACPWSKTLSL